MTDKTDLVPDKPFAARPPGRSNLTIAIMRYRDWATKPPTSIADGGSIDGSVPGVMIPWCISATVLDEADKSDPENQIRVYCLKIGKRLAYKMTFSGGMGDDDIRRLALMGALVIGVEHGAEIRDAIAKERAVPAAE